jgi:hypothetical protein
MRCTGRRTYPDCSEDRRPAQPAAAGRTGCCAKECLGKATSLLHAPLGCAPALVSVPNTASARARSQTFRGPAGTPGGGGRSVPSVAQGPTRSVRGLRWGTICAAAASAPRTRGSASSRISPIYPSRIPWPNCPRRPVRIGPTPVLFRTAARNGRADGRNAVPSRRREELSGCWPGAFMDVGRSRSPCCRRDLHPVLRVRSCSDLCGDARSPGER